ncbi:MAG: M23 family metallopeptidase [Firmicutes bacterium]|jgi:murein DD-endopeptidase MepM/ murein hydrolase activator NlpD|nr:M23 family metallopeptidase [Bacillota bacterium]
MEKKGQSKPLEALKVSGQKLMRSVSSRWQERWLAWVSLGLMVIVTVGGLFYLAADWSHPYQDESEDFYWSELSAVPEPVDKPTPQETVNKPPTPKMTTPAANPPLIAEAEVVSEPLAPHDQEADPGPEPEIALKPVMAPSQAFAELARPVQGEITSSFGWRRHPVFADWRYHPGVDMDAATGTEVMAVMAGAVAEVKQDDVWGKLVVLDHGGQRSSTYAHLDQVEVEVGQAVEKGQRIGTAGQTGITDQPHLHLELRLEGTAVDPALYLPPVVKSTPLGTDEL